MEKGEEAKYIITGSKNEELLINVAVSHGEVEVEATDYEDLKVTKSSSEKNHTVLIAIPAKDMNKKDNKNKNAVASLSGYDYSFFHSIHLRIKSKDSKKGAMFTVSYSMGEPAMYLQDGLITTLPLLANKTTKLYYNNPHLSKIYLHMSMNDSAALNKVKVAIKALNNPNDEESGVEIQPEKPNFRKKTPNPTMLMTLPANHFFQIEVSHPEKTLEWLTVGVNNQEIIYLPLSHEFPVRLEKNEYIYLMVNAPYFSYLLVDVRKCDETALSFSYTLDYDSFLAEEFTNQEEIPPEEMQALYFIKGKQSSALYLKIQSPPEEVAVITVKATLYFSKNKPELPKAGNKGEMTFQSSGNGKLDFNFAPVVCPPKDKTCSGKDFNYTAVTADSPQHVYAQLMCPSVAFDLEDRQIINSATVTPITVAKNAKNITFSQ